MAGTEVVDADDESFSSRHDYGGEFASGEDDRLEAEVNGLKRFC